MRYYCFLFFCLCIAFNSVGQEYILFDLDSYRRVDFDFRTTFISPDIDLRYVNEINTPNQNKNYRIGFDGVYNDIRIVNNLKNQKTWSNRVDMGILSGTSVGIDLNSQFDYSNRSYSEESNYFLNGAQLTTNLDFTNPQNSDSRINSVVNVKYDLGFGFGRLEVVDNAWIGGRILEDLNKKGLLKVIPDSDEMRTFFDLIGSLQFTRVMDFRLAAIYRLERIVEYIESQGWIEDGSIPAFATIYDTYRYEQFSNRWTGERLEFTLSPTLRGVYIWRDNNDLFTFQSIGPGFEGKIDYEWHTNGDLEYYKKKVVGAKLAYIESFQKQSDLTSSNRFIDASLFVVYEYRYIPSLRTNLVWTTLFDGGFMHQESLRARVNVSSSLVYNYYVSPATQLVLRGSLGYSDNEFQSGDYQPRILASFSFDVLHALR